MVEFVLGVTKDDLIHSRTWTQRMLGTACTVRTIALSSPIPDTGGGMPCQVTSSQVYWMAPCYQQVTTGQLPQDADAERYEAEPYDQEQKLASYNCIATEGRE